MTRFILTVITETPLWVWGLLAALIALGLRQSRDQVVAKPWLLIRPVAIGSLSLLGATSTFGLHLAVQPMWLLGVAAGLAISRSLRLPHRLQPLQDGRFAISGSWAPLALMMSIFALRYVSSAALAIEPLLAGESAFAAVASALYGLPAGLVAARALQVLGAARPTPRVLSA